jgi:hypothetical protein
MTSDLDQEPTDTTTPARKKCIVPKCRNHTDEGSFIGDLCMPCHNFLMDPATSKYSQLYMNFVEFAERKYRLRELGAILKNIFTL